ncbi:MAG: hypothetical protein WAO95_12235 [Burkholderiales bacterium]
MTVRPGAEKLFAELRVALLHFGRSRYPIMRDEVEDLAAESLADLVEYLQRRSESKSGKRAKADEVALRKVAFTIFKRRAADAYRRGAKRWAMESLDSSVESVADSTRPTNERSLLLRRMLQVCVAELADLGREDRLALAIVTGSRREGAVDARTRQRVHRLRQRLARAIRRELGEDASRLLREE